MKKISIFLILGLLIFSQVALGEENKTKPRLSVAHSPYIVSEKVGILPTSPLYFTKELWRGIKLFFTFDPVKKADLESQIADEKLAELVKVYETSKSKEALQKAVQNYVKTQEKLTNRIKNLEVNPKVEELITKLAERNTRHLILFDELIAKEKDQLIIDDLIQARQSSDAITANQVDKSWRAAQAGIENVLNNLPYPEGVKELKALEVLTKIEEKLPEEAKKGIETAKENIEKRLIEEGKIQSAQKWEALQSSEGWYAINGVPVEKQAVEKVIEELEEKAKEVNPVSQRPNIVNIEAIKELKTKIEEAKPAETNLVQNICESIEKQIKQLEELFKNKEIDQETFNSKVAILKKELEKCSKPSDQPSEEICESIVEKQIKQLEELLKNKEIDQEAFNTKVAILKKELEKCSKPSGQPSEEQSSVPKPIGPVCPQIAPDTSKGLEECLKAAKSLEEKYQGCDYASICKSSPKLQDIEKCGPMPLYPTKEGCERICKDGKWQDVCKAEPGASEEFPYCGKIQCIRYDPVCGTDGKTYACGEGDAKACGVDVAYKGECKPSSSTPPSQDQIFCTQEWNPVCGTDGKTYSNECMAKAAGVGVAYKGECQKRQSSPVEPY